MPRRKRTRGEPVEQIVTLGEIADHWQRWRAGEYLGLDWTPQQFEWAGVTKKQVDEYIAHGFSGGDPLTMPDAAAELHVPSILYDEDEGDLVYQLAYNGEDQFRVRWENLPAPRGLSVAARYSFAARVPADVPTAYAEFLLSAVDGIERMGETPDVTVYTEYETVNGPGVRVSVPIRRAGETMDVASWRALFAPGGFRILFFLATAIACRKAGLTLYTGFRPIFPCHDWTVTLREGEVLDIQPDRDAYDVPAEQLTRCIAEVLK